MEHGRESKREGLSATSLGNGDHVTTAQSHGPRLALNRCRSGEALGLNGGHEVVGEPDFVESGDRTRDVAALHL
jgi:hypothetical protein